MTTKSKRLYTNQVFKENDYLIFGSETAGISEKILISYPDNTCTIPMENKNINVTVSDSIFLDKENKRLNA